MNSVYGIEANPLIFDIPEFERFLSTNSKVLEIYDSTYIFTDEEEALQAKELLKEADLFEETHHLLLLGGGKEKECFYDYGFKGQKGVYLYKELLSAATLYGEDHEMLEMAKLQLEEHLVYTATKEVEEIFFFDTQLDSLIKGISQAYKCEARFLDLDKWKKKL